MWAQGQASPCYRDDLAVAGHATGSPWVVVLMAGDVDHVAVWRANEEPSQAPGSVVSGWTISNPASFRFLVGLLDAVADGDGDHRVVRSGGIAGDELNDGPAVGRLEAGNQAHVNPSALSPRYSMEKSRASPISGTDRFAMTRVGCTGGSCCR